MKMIYAKRLHIHSCFASWSSNDVILYKETTKEFFDVDNTKKESCEKFGYGLIFLEDNQYNVLKYATKQQMQELVDFYKSSGWVEKIEELSKRMKEKETTELKNYCNERKRNNFIFYTSPNWEYNQKEAQGGFSDQFWNYQPVVKYTETHSFGYFGHSVRKPELDKYFERCIKVICQCTKVDLDWKKIAYNYLSSSSARHFADNLEGIGFSEQKRRIFSNLKSIWNQAYVYSLEEHSGTYDSTEWLM